MNFGGVCPLIIVYVCQHAFASSLKDMQDQFPTIYRQFEDFMREHEKSYESDSEKLERFAIFMDNVQEMERMNSESDGDIEFGVNRFSDLTLEEFKSQFTHKSSSFDKFLTDSALDEDEEETFPGVFDLTALGGHATKLTKDDDDDPNGIDWRKLCKHYPPAQDQKDCGSCYTFATAGVIEILESKIKGKMMRFSKQELVDCSKNDKCDGGMFEPTFDYCKNPGLALEKDYPYKAKNGTCKKKVKSAVKVKSYMKISEKRIIESLKECPLAIAMTSGTKEIMNYKKGVLRKFKECDPEGLNHAVAMVGYQHVGDEIIWIVRNSWGTSWGEKGHFRILKGLCGIGTENFKFALKK